MSVDLAEDDGIVKLESPMKHNPSTLNIPPLN